jgi:hypothetical protein
MKRKDVHVVPLGKEWAVEASGMKFEPFTTQEDAIEFGRRRAEHDNCELVVHSREEQNSHGEPPSPMR